jgi:hypothetical protein
MPTWAWILIAVAAAVVLGMIVAAALSTRRRAGLQRRFGPEYDRTVDARGDRRSAEAELRERELRRDKLDIVELSPAAREHYVQQWHVTQERFVDQPGAAVREADLLVQSVMRERGYPIDDFDTRAGDISVDHPHVVEEYRAAHAISTRNDHGQATTEDLRQALVHYRALFAELLGDARDEPLSRDESAQTDARETMPR